jgi:polysaccharide biosynthesis transport protein
VLATVAGGLGAAALTAALPRDYRAEATLVLTGPGASRDRQLTYVQLASSRRHLEGVSARTGISIPDLRKSVRVVPAPGSFVIGVFATDEDPGRAAAIANAVAESFPGFLLEAGIADPESVELAVRADPPERPLASLAFNAVLGACIGALAALTVAWWSRETGDRNRLPGDGPTVERSVSDDNTTVETGL